MPMSYAFSDFSVLSNRSEGTARVQAGRNGMILGWDAGWNNLGDKARYEGQLLYERYADVNFGLLAGVRVSNRKDVNNTETRAVAGGWYRLPYLAVATATLDSQGAGRLELAKTFQLSARLGLETRGRYDTDELWEGAATLNYTPTKNLSLSAGYHSEYGFGGGLGFRF